MSSKVPAEKSTIALQQDFGAVLQQIQESRQKVFAQVNTALMGHSKLSAVLRELHPSVGNTFKDMLCCDKDDEVVECALSRNLSPTLIAQYQLQLPDKQLLQAKLHELFSQLLDGDDDAQQGGGL
jgi:hypothetical protein